MPEYARVCKSMQEYARVCQNLPEYAKAFLIFVIFFTRAKFLENKIYTEIYTVNCQFTQQIANLLSKLQIFRVKSVKIYTGQKKITRTPSVASVTNMRLPPILRFQQ